ncbi:2-deoxystreptamine N-acetyl-D-glucosaminyltransferase [Jannaschia seosinensis]|uniref:2-deoxystreptamine N-acetyl-D-glucosaminyltransferase n=1 Tax=Jannaschia seosinensis TaxID=313367 RepID=A0A0M7BGP7_9RHOB|nr:glycosyltransferase [Jannaschia seosinensis]CUH40952.1 2-deoxystreptamine N-acetyl-D-glucosaminyltransferase [Jannaschia seosinensis]
MASLLVISSAPATLVDEKPFLDIKFVEGMRYYNDLWDGPVSCILKLRHDTFPFGQLYEPDQLPFNVTFLPPNKSIGTEELSGQDIILCGGDNHEHLHMADICRNAGKKLAFIIEYIPKTRRQIIFLDPSRSLPRKLYSLLWTMKQERRRRRAFRMADGLQANGYPAFSVYSPMNANTMMYLDNRVGKNLLATENEMAVRQQRLLSGAPLRLVHSGRLEHLKGSQDLIPIARRLESKGVDFTLDIFGTGSLEEEIRKSIAVHGLQDRVRLNGTVDFESGLVPFARQHADVYLSCHRQSDPSCTYIESMGCGLAVIGYANRMWSALCQESDAGWVGPMGNTNALADAVYDAAKDRQRLAASCHAAWSFAARHSFENEFRSRIENMQSLVRIA